MSLEHNNINSSPANLRGSHALDAQPGAFLKARAQLHPGMEFITLNQGEDLDHDGRERVTPAGSVGTLGARATSTSWSIHFESGAAWIVDDAELLDTTQWKPTSTGCLKACLMRIDYLHNQCEMTVLDDPLVDELAHIASNASQLIKRMADSKEIQ